MIPRRRSPVSMASDAVEVAQLAGQITAVQADAAASSAASMSRANSAMSKANSATALAQIASDTASGLQVLADQFQSALASSVGDRQGLHTDVQALKSRATQDEAQIDSLVSAVAGKASAEALSQANSTISALASQVAASTAAAAAKASQAGLDALAATVASKASQVALDALAASIASKASQAVVNGLADAVGLVQTGLSSLAARVSTLELRPVVAVRQGSATLPAILLLGTVDVKVTWPSPLPSATYVVVRDLADDGGDQFRAKVKSQTATDCTITIRALVGLSAGAKLDVVAIHTS